ncbi:MAG: IPT/TIG domain-containing protein [Planctomycetes bacterium]|nr:IPT/TIG domain-containing protein [Planctomycetota bacterium]
MSVDWGDGTSLDTSTGYVTSSGSTLTVYGTHTWAEVGYYNTVATITRGSFSIVLKPSFVVDEAAITVSVTNITASAGTALNNVQVATFTDADTSSVVADFFAWIYWGDWSGAAEGGTVSGSSGNFTVYGSHTYMYPGSYTFRVGVGEASGYYVTGPGTATITGPVTAHAVAVTATEGTSTGSQTVATFTTTASGPFSATIDGGDGHVSAGTVSANGSGGYNVNWSNTFGSAGNFPLRVRIFNNGVLSSVVDTTASVSPPPLTVLGSSLSTSVAAALNNVVVARFTDPNATHTADFYSALVDFGDGNIVDGTVIAEGGGTFAVLASNTYARAGTYSVDASISDEEGSTADVLSSVSVAASGPVVTGLSTSGGPPEGGTAVTITGTGLFNATGVSFGGTAATTFLVNPDGSITAVAPVLASGSTVDVQVTTASGTSATSTADRFTALAAAPTITGLSATSGATGGTNTLTITGTNLVGTNQLLFGTTPADSFSIDSATQITATVPAAVSGTIDITATNPYGTSSTSTADQYTYVATAPVVTALYTTSGPVAGGNLVTIVGSNFNGTTGVSFGGVAATFEVFSSTTIVATAPVLTAGTVHVQVTTPYGTSATSSADQYTAVDAPTITGLSSTSGPTGGGGTITITGTGFTGASRVAFGDIDAAFTVASSTSITATVPPAVAGAVTVSVQTPGGVSAGGSSAIYTYNGTAPTVTALSVNRRPLAGGTQVVISGTNLNGATGVVFGSVAATEFNIDSATQITATAPAGTSGTINVTVTTPYGTSSTSSASQFTYADAAAPAVTDVSVSGTTVPSGPMAGGTSVVLTGSGFTAATLVLFGDVAASFVVNSDTQITATAPAGNAGTVDVSVETPYGVSLASPFDRYSYLAAAPSITSLSLTSGSTAGGDSVTISGANFLGATRVTFNGVDATFTVNSDSSITATTPLAPAGTGDVVVWTPAGSSSTGTQTHFTFNAATGVATVTGLSTTSGATGGGTSVTLTGTHFTSATRVLFGSVSVTSFIVNSDTSLTAVTPPGVAGSVSVQVINDVGMSATGGTFTYVATAPSVTGLSIASGPAAGGTAVTITGSNLNGASAVSFGSVAASTYVINSPTSITAIAPAQAAATVSVSVTTAAGTSSSSGASQFTYVSASAPTVTSVFPGFGPTAGGTQMMLVGTGFTNASQVLFDGSAASTFTVNDDTHITATAPPHASGTINVQVVTPAGTSDPANGVAFLYTAIGPAISSLGTTSGPTAGGTVVTINGSNLTGTTGVFFGTTPALLFRVVNDGQISAVSPLAAPGAVQVTIVTPNGTSPTGTGTTFTFNTGSTTTPTVTSLSTSSGPSSGGTVLTLTGTNLAGTTSVFFGNTPALFSFVSSTSLSVTAPPGVVGTVDVTVLTPLGISATSTADHFTYQTAVPTVTALSPSTATTAGGVSVQITGTNVVTATGVAFGDTPVYQYTINSNTSITALAPVHAAGTLDVTVTNRDGTSSPSTGSPFTWTTTTSTPTVTSLSPSSGPTGGGTSVTITGTNFTNVSGVFFGTMAAASYSVASATQITAVSPAAVAGATTVTVATAAGVSSAGIGTTFTFNATAPTVTALSVSSGPTAGGTTVVLTGTNLNGATAVSFNGTAASSFSIDSPTQITATTAAGTAGSGYAVVTTPYGTSSTGTANQFTYVAAPTVSGLSVTSGSTSGGTSVTITGTNFSGLVAASFGGVPAATLSVTSSPSLTVTTPARGPGTVDVVVTTSTGTSTTSTADQFTFTAPVPTITSVSPAAGPVAGGTWGGHHRSGTHHGQLDQCGQYSPRWTRRRRAADHHRQLHADVDGRPQRGTRWIDSRDSVRPARRLGIGQPGRGPQRYPAERLHPGDRQHLPGADVCIAHWHLRHHHRPPTGR